MASSNGSLIGGSVASTTRRAARNSISSQRSILRLLPHLFALLLVSTISFYGGVLTGMHVTCDSKKTGDENNNDEFNRHVSVEVERRLNQELNRRQRLGAAAALEEALDEAKYGEDGNIEDGNNGNDVDGRIDVNSSYNNKQREEKGINREDKESRRRFPSTVSKFATGIALVGKNDFLELFDYGIPKPPSKRIDESDPGKDHVLLLYGHTKALPNINTNQVVYHSDGLSDGGGEDSSTTQPPQMLAADATTNCKGLNIIFTETHDSELHQCTAIVGNYESYHIQRWLRMNPTSYNKLDPSYPLTPVGRGLQTNGQDKFAAPEDRYALQNQAMLETYFDRLQDTLEKLEPMAKSCAGNDNTVIVMVCNTGQSDLLINFICSARARGFGDVVNSKVLVFATDEGVLQIAQGLGLNAFYDEEIFKDMPEHEARIYGDRTFTQMMYAKVVTVQLINRMGYDVLFQDVDLVWYQNPLTYFHDKSNPNYSFDILFQDDGARTTRYAPYSANTGFYYVRNNDKTKFLFRSLLYLGDMVLSMTSHQQAMGALLDEHSSLTGLRVKTLSAYDFPGGYHYHRKKEIPVMKDIVQGKYHPYVFHMSWTTNKHNKILFLQQMGLWYTNSQCEDGGGVNVLAAKSSDMNSCCSAKPLISCHYKDKPSVEECKNSDAPSIDAGKKGASFW